MNISDVINISSEEIDKEFKPKVSALEGLLRKYESIENLTSVASCEAALTRLNRIPVIVDDIKFELSSLDLIQVATKSLLEEFNDKLEEYNNKEIRLLELVDKKSEEFKKDKLTDVLQVNANRERDRVENNKPLEELLVLQSYLESKYSKKIKALADSYKINISDVEFDNSFTIPELRVLLLEFKEELDKESVLKDKVMRYVDYEGSELLIGISLLMVIVLLSTNLAAFVFVGYFAYSVYKKYRVRDYNRRLILLLGLLYGLDIKALGYKDDIEPEVLNISEEEENEVLNYYADEIGLNAFYDGHNPNEDYQELLRYIINNDDEIVDKLSIVIRTLIAKLDSILEKRAEIADLILKRIEEIKASHVPLGTVISDSYMYNPKYVLGLKDSTEDEVVNTGLQNILIRPCSDAIKMKQFIQTMFVNAFCNVAINKITAHVYDPNNNGRDLIDFYQPDLANHMRIYTEDLEKCLTELKTKVDKNMKIIKDSDVNAYNEESARIGRTPISYELLIILSQPKKLEDSEELVNFMRYSSKYGVIVWCVTDMSIPDTHVFNMPYEGVTNPYPIDSDFLADFSEFYLDEWSSNKSPSLPFNVFRDKAAPLDKFWSMVTDEYIDIDAGFYNGDPTQFKPYTVGNEGDIHALAVGGTGAGKSVFLNNIITCMTTKYGPQTLELWLVDYKGAEFSLYLPNKETGVYLPHIKACLCTSDGEYAGSLYQALEDEARRRYQMLKEVGHKNLYSYNKWLRKQGRGDECLPRILSIQDEFQVIFEDAEGDTKEQIKSNIKYISKVARAAGIHLLFASQSMKGTVSDDVLQQFTLRFGLRCDEEVSKDVMGAPTSSSIKERNGYLYVRTFQAKTAEEQRLHRTPFIEPEIPGHIEMCHNKAKELGFKSKRLITYEESTEHFVGELREFREKNRELIDGNYDSGLMILGNRMTYSENAAPDNIVLSRDSNTHIMGVFQEQEDLVNFYKSLRVNMEYDKVPGIIMANSALPDLHNLLELESNIDERFQEFTVKDYSAYDTIALLEQMYDIRVATDAKEQPLYYFLVGWDKAVGIGVDKDHQLTNRLGSVLNKCGEYNIHVIMLSQSMGAMPVSIVEAIKFKCCGKTSVDNSTVLMGSRIASKESELKNGYMYIRKETNKAGRNKIYKSSGNRKIVSKELVM